MVCISTQVFQTAYVQVEVFVVRKLAKTDTERCKVFTSYMRGQTQSTFRGVIYSIFLKAEAIIATGCINQPLNVGTDEFGQLFEYLGGLLFSQGAHGELCGFLSTVLSILLTFESDEKISQVEN